MKLSRSLLAVRSKHGNLDEGARFHVITHLILETVNFAKSMLATSILGRDDTVELSSSTKESGFILNLVQRDRVLAAVCFQPYRCFFLLLAKLIVSYFNYRFKSSFGLLV